MNGHTKTAIGFGVTSLLCLAIALVSFAIRWPAVAEVFVAAAIVMASIAFVSWFVGVGPDDDSNDANMSLPTRRALALYLIGIGALLLSVLTWLLWFDFTSPVKAPAGTTVIPNIKGVIDTWWWGRVEISRNMQLFLLALAAGALGSYIHAIKSLADFLGNRTAKTSWFWFYITRPFLGSALATLFYAVIRGGFMNGTPAEANAVSPFGVIAICGLVGMFADRASQKLGDVFDTLFTTNDTRRDKLAAADPRTLDPATVPMNGQVRDVAVKGSNLGDTAGVRIDAAERKPKTVGSDMVVFRLTDAEVSARRQVTIRLVTTGGDVSKPLTLYVSDLHITTLALPDGQVGRPYTAQLGAAGGAPPYSWGADGLPNGLTCSAAGTLAGQPAAAATVPVNITVADHDGAPVVKSLQLTIAP